jgi:oligoendopeptidase F
MSAPVASYSSQGHRWNLQSLYNGIEDPRLDSDFAESVAEADAFAAAYRGRIESGQITAAELAEAIAKLEALVEKSSKPGACASCSSRWSCKPWTTRRWTP